MLLIRRPWLLPVVGVVLVLYYFYSSSPQIIAPITIGTRLVIQPERYPVKNYAQLPSLPARQLPRVQYEFPVESDTQRLERLERAEDIRNAFIHSWQGYKRYAWRQDEVTPLSGLYRNPFGGWGASLVDAMSTLWIMGLTQEFEEAVKAVNDLDFSTSSEETVNVFETTIRYLGGLLSAYDVSDHKYPILLAKSIELADVLYVVFDTENRMPVTRWPWKQSAAGIPLQVSKATLLAEIGSMSLEFTRLAQLTGDDKWYDAIDRIATVLYNAQDHTQIPGLWPTLVDAVTGNMSAYNHFTLGGMADSTSEYLVKQYILLGGLDARYQAMYEKMIAAAKKHLFYQPLVPDGPAMLMSGNAARYGDKIRTEFQVQHLTCFLGGMVGLAAKIFDRPDELLTARHLVEGCIWAYNSTPSGLMPETFHIASCHVGVPDASLEPCEWSTDRWYEFVTEYHGGLTRKGESQSEAGERIALQESLLSGYTRWGDNRYILRPEAIESVFILYRLTGDRVYLDVAWRMWNSIKAACRTPLAYAAVSDVRLKMPLQSDRMESFWLAETLKYFFLIFSPPHEWSLDDWVLNTEAHPLRRPRAGHLLTEENP